MTRPRLWRPRTFGEIIGRANTRSVRRLQQAARERSLVITLILGPYGCAKTSLARLLMASFCCQAPDPQTADPCQRCEGCLRQGPGYNGEFHTCRHWEIDCTGNIGRKEVANVLMQARQEDPVAIFFDELPRLSEQSAQSPLLTFTHDLRQGLFLAAAAYGGTAEQPELPRVLPPLFERMRKVYLSLPEVEEMVSFFRRMTPQWQVQTEDSLLREMVMRTGRSFRSCLDVLDAAACNDPPVLDRDTLDEFLPPA